MANIRLLSIILQQKAIEELNEDVSRIPLDIQTIKDWLHYQKHIKARTDDQSILTVLRGCKFSLERAKEKIESYYTMRSLLPELFKNRDPFRPEIQYLLKSGIILPLLNQKDPRAPQVVLLNCSIYDPVKVNKADILKVDYMFWDILHLEDDQMNINGLHVLLEFDGIQMSQILPPALIIKATKFLQESLPTRVKGIHSLNMPSFYNATFNLMRSFMNDKLKKRLTLIKSSNDEELYKIIPKDELPKEYDGDGPSLQDLRDFWKKKMESYAEWFKDDEQYCSDEKLRPGTLRTVQEWFEVEGVDGSFRKLNID